MTPPVLRSSLGSAIRSPSSLTLKNRAFSTTIRYSQIPPESPRFIEVPQPPQQRAPVLPVIRGTLPPPRDVFESRGGKDKTTAKYLKETMPERTPSKIFARDEQAAWKRRMADMRRRSLREGLAALHTRKVKKDEALEYRSRKKMEWRDRQIKAPLRDDQKYTSSTVPQTVNWEQHGPLPDPDRESRIATSVANVKAKEAEKEGKRQDALHSLYMHARSFITTEAQLNEKIEELFTDLPFKRYYQSSSVMYSDNIWDAKSAPPTVADMLSSHNKTELGLLAQNVGPAVLVGKRVTRIAEELTGGKMDTDPKTDTGSSSSSVASLR